MNPTRSFLVLGSILLALAALSGARAAPDRPALGLEELRAEIAAERERANVLEARVAELEKRHPRLSNKEIEKSFLAVAARHRVTVVTSKAEALATTLSFRVERANASLRDMSRFLADLRKSLLGTGLCKEVTCNSVEVRPGDAPGVDEVLSTTIDLTRLPLK